jgi:hypothetical protein
MCTASLISSPYLQPFREVIAVAAILVSQVTQRFVFLIAHVAETLPTARTETTRAERTGLHLRVHWDDVTTPVARMFFAFEVPTSLCSNAERTTPYVFLSHSRFSVCFLNCSPCVRILAATSMFNIPLATAFRKVKVCPRFPPGQLKMIASSMFSTFRSTVL